MTEFLCKTFEVMALWFFGTNGCDHQFVIDNFDPRLFFFWSWDQNNPHRDSLDQNHNTSSSNKQNYPSFVFYNFNLNSWIIFWLKNSFLDQNYSRAKSISPKNILDLDKFSLSVPLYMDDSDEKCTQISPGNHIKFRTSKMFEEKNAQSTQILSQIPHVLIFFWTKLE